MASTDKTPKLGLNQWAAGDDVLRADFNADNGKIDTAVEANRVAAIAAAAAATLEAKNAVLKMASGSLPGDDTQFREFVIGFRPRLLFFVYAHQHGGMDIVNDEIIINTVISNPPRAHPRHDSEYIFTDTGFRMGKSDANHLNFNMYYIALG